MPVSIHIKDRRAEAKYRAPIKTIYGKTMGDALRAACRWCASVELAAGPTDHAPDTTLYLYDSLGGLRAEMRRRDRVVSIKKT